MEKEINLDELIKEDKQKASKEKTKRIHKASSKSYTKRYFNSRRQYKDHPNEISNQINQRKYEENLSNMHKYQKKYALLVTGFVSDVSSDDIYKLCGQRKITNIRTWLKAKSYDILDKKNMNMEVLITFTKKQDADSFIKQYSDRKLDGKHTLTFQFKRPY